MEKRTPGGACQTGKDASSRGKKLFSGVPPRFFLLLVRGSLDLSIVLVRNPARLERLRMTTDPGGRLY